ncbi:MAG: DUF5329 family protein [Bacteroidetes bacterium]|nr:DUF5329 family protein [Bacteroidota bacterium]
MIIYFYAMKYLLFFSLFAFSLKIQNTLTENQKIDKLILYIRNMKDVVFVRNGTDYKSGEAADHLQRKRKSVGDKIKTAEDFISKVASKSSVSGQPYMIKTKDGKAITCESLLRAELLRLEKRPDKF